MSPHFPTTTSPSVRYEIFYSIGLEGLLYYMVAFNTSGRGKRLIVGSDSGGRARRQSEALVR